mmetsp:Transcript_46680/g.73074  ORF Transcript_46680/g.73074 Transcript_46680/m.73074 type:complete len:433 (+) Transcript_46680:64-1362(+)|eukprot:CAMPEP_0184319570 /NCGR_PEP_ID=MMETSP1049-20130417/109250_1 /TAXON_ID=77928 /ORGANISM="Proteomonas sulcata, Strain CCMP704" /LENGTH=432 /DNA_ID=CAMNT_0026639747 /DNA_START=36 /DNA_END=1334 /DNA_ORIENTATION=-
MRQLSASVSEVNAVSSGRARKQINYAEADKAMDRMVSNYNKHVEGDYEWPDSEDEKQKRSASRPTRRSGRTSRVRYNEDEDEDYEDDDDDNDRRNPRRSSRADTSRGSRMRVESDSEASNESWHSDPSNPDDNDEDDESEGEDASSNGRGTAKSASVNTNGHSSASRSPVACRVEGDDGTNIFSVTVPCIHKEETLRAIRCPELRVVGLDFVSKILRANTAKCGIRVYTAMKEEGAWEALEPKQCHLKPGSFEKSWVFSKAGMLHLLQYFQAKEANAVIDINEKDLESELEELERTTEQYRKLILPAESRPKSAKAVPGWSTSETAASVAAKPQPAATSPSQASSTEQRQNAASHPKQAFSGPGSSSPAPLPSNLAGELAAVAKQERAAEGALTDAQVPKTWESASGHRETSESGVATDTVVPEVEVHGPQQ